MDTHRQTIRLDDEPATVTFDTDLGPTEWDVEPVNGPGIYEATLRLVIPEDGDYTVKARLIN